MAPPPGAAAPPRGQPLPPRQRSPVLRTVVGILLALIILVGLIALITWLAVRPKKLHYSLEHGSISGYNLTNDRLNASFHFVLRANNPNRRVSLYYDEIIATVFYEDQKLSINDVRRFYQPRRNVTHLDLNLMAKDAAIYGGVARDLRLEKASGDIGLDVRIRAKIRVKVGIFKIHRKLKIFCGPVTIPFSPNKDFERVLCESDMD